MARKSDSPRPSRSEDTQANEQGLPSFATVHVWQIQAVRDILVVAAALGIVWTGYVLRAVTVPLLIALLLAYLFEPLVSKLSRSPRVTRARVVSGLMALVVVLVLATLSVVIPLMVAQSIDLFNDLRGGRIRTNLERASTLIPSGYQDQYRRVIDLLPGGPPTSEALDPSPAAADQLDAAAPQEQAAPLTEERVRELVAEAMLRNPDASAARPPGWSPSWIGLAGAGWHAVLGMLGTVLEAGLLLFLIPFYFFFFSLWYPGFIRFGRNLLPQKNKKQTILLLNKMDAVVSGFVRGRIVISLVMGVLLAIGWMICGVPYALLLGLLIGVFCAVPYLGGIGVPVAVALLFFDRLGDPEHGAWWWAWVLLWPTVVFAIVQVIEGYILTPVISGKVTKLDPVTIIVAVLAGGSVLGIYGMLLAIPIAACLKILFPEVLLPRIHAWAKGDAEDPLPINRG